jgi:hypothetical protein
MFKKINDLVSAASLLFAGFHVVILNAALLAGNIVLQLIKLVWIIRQKKPLPHPELPYQLPVLVRK